jgi:hypothetical protein
MITWTISQLDRHADDGGVIVAHWQATSVDGEYSASIYGTASFSPDPDAPGFIPYDELTEDEVLGWVWNDGVDKDATEAALDAQIEALINPTTLTGVPWVTA